MDGFRMVWGPWWPRYPGHSGPRTGARLDGGHCGPRLNLGLSGRFQRLNLGQIDPVNDGETVLTGPCASLDKDALTLNRALGTPDSRTVTEGGPRDRESLLEERLRLSVAPH